jgi:uncharacterized protein YbjT (DUF2867 family)
MTGPIAVMGASGHVGTSVCRRLTTLAIDVRPLGRDDDLGSALRDAAAVVHLAGSLRPRPPSSYEEANVRTAESLVVALSGSSVERIVFLSYVGANRSSPNAFIRTKGEAEDLMYRTGRDCVVFRCTHIFGPPDEPGRTVSVLLAENGRPVWVLGSGTQRLAPVYREDVVDAIVAALDPRTHHGRFDLPGPDELTMDEFVRIVNGGSARLRHVPALVARALGRTHPGLTPELVDLLLADSRGEQLRAVRTFGLERRRLEDVYGRRAAAAA